MSASASLLSDEDRARQRAVVDQIIAAAGGRLAAAAQLGVVGSAVSNWRVGRARPSIEAAQRIEAVFGIPRGVVRPDVWDISDHSFTAGASPQNEGARA